MPYDGVMNAGDNYWSMCEVAVYVNGVVVNGCGGYREQMVGFYVPVQKGDMFGIRGVHGHTYTFILFPYK